MLKLSDVFINYDSISAIKGINLHIKEGEIVTILGSNGAGKTTTLKAISGLIPIKTGEIIFDGKKISGLPPNKIVSLGLAQSPEGRLIFPDLTVLENLELGAYLRKDNIRPDLEYVYGLFPILNKRKKQLAGTLSGGEQQMLAIARAYMAAPKLLLLDEPSLGIAPILVKTIFKAIKEINEKGITILLVEQNAQAALKLANRGYVLQTGKVLLEGNAADLLKNDQVKAAYLGH
jgi:branched-chain amino acid transport system ATP-binding protein